MAYESAGTASDVCDHCSVIGTVLDRSGSAGTADETSHTLVSVCRSVACVLAELVILDRSVVGTVLHCSICKSSHDSAAASCRSREVTIVGTL